MPVRRHLLGWLLRNVERRSEEALGRVHIAMLTQQRVDQIALAINRSIQVLPDAADPDVGFVNVPGASSLALALGAQRVGDQRREADFPRTHRFVREREAALEKHLRQIAQTQLVAHAPQHHEEDDIGGVFEVIEGRAGTLIEGAPTGLTAKDPIAELGGLRQCRRRGRRTLWTGHQTLLSMLVQGWQRYQSSGKNTILVLSADASPHPSRLTDIMTRIQTIARRQIENRLVAGLSPQHLAQVDGLLQSGAGRGKRGPIPLSWLREPPSLPSAKALDTLRTKWEFLRALQLPPLPSTIHRTRLLKLARTGAEYTPHALFRLPPKRRYPLLRAHLAVLETDVVDATVDMFDKLVGDLHRKGERKLGQLVKTQAKDLNQTL